MASALIEEVFNRINTHKGVEGIIISDINGVPIKSTFEDDQLTYFYTTSASFFIRRCMTLVKALLKEDLSFIRIRISKNEIMIAPDKDFLLLVVQSASSTGN